MTRSRRRGSKWLAAAATAGFAAACSSHPGAAPDGGTGDGATLPGFDAPPPTGLFPLGVSSDGTHLVTAAGQPFLLHGEAAWSLIAQLTTAQTMQYLADRHRRGVNAILVNLIEAFYSNHPPSNAAGDPPFIVASTNIADVDFSMPSEAYFAHADQVIDLAASQGIAVLLFPSYLGLMAQEGWRNQMSTMGATKCASYGRFVGQRYAGKKNIVWMWGGDYTPTMGSSLEACMKAISDAIRAAAPGALASAHWAFDRTSRDEQAFVDAIDLVGVYNYQDSLQDICRSARTDSPRMPTYLIETCYEGETVQSRCSPDPFDARRRQFWGWLGCGAGQIYGIGGLWQFSSTWQDDLGAPAAVSASRLLAIAQQVSWQTLSPDDALVTAGKGSTGMPDEVIATRTADHKQAVIYIPPAIPPSGASTITVDLTQLSGSVTATWQDPTADHSVAAGNALTGSHVFQTPGNNDGGDSDWALVLTAP